MISSSSPGRPVKGALRTLLFALPILAAAQQPGWIAGVARNKLTQAPVGGVKVRMTLASDTAQRYEAVTDPNGAYRIEDLPAGDYLPAVDAPSGFYGPNPMDLALKRKVHVTDRGAQFAVEMTPHSAIRGRLLDPDGEPVAGAAIFAIPIDGIMPGSGKTDDQGHFSVMVAPGKYCLQARPQKDRWPRTFYPDVTDAAAAEAIAVAEGAEVGGYDIRLHASRQRSLRGVVHDDAGKPVAGVEVVLSTPAVLIEQVARVKSDAKGAFEFTSVAPGQWQISAAVSREGVPWNGKTAVAMADRELNGVDLRLDPPFAWDVELASAPEQFPNPIQIDLRAVAGSATEHAIAKPDRPARFGAIYPGAYRLAVNGSIPGYYLKSIWIGAGEIAGLPVEVGPESPPLRLVYATGGGRIIGDVENGAGAQVVLIWADRSTGMPGQEIRTIYCNAEGRFTVNDLRPGNWYAFAFADARIRGSITETVFDRGFWRQAESVGVREGDTVRVQLKILPRPE